MTIRRFKQLFFLVIALTIAGYLIRRQDEKKSRHMEENQMPKRINQPASKPKLTTRADELTPPSRVLVTDVQQMENTVKVRWETMRKTMRDTCAKFGLNRTFTGKEIYSKNPYLNKSLFFSDKYKVLFCLMPKCASRSQAEFLTRVEGISSDSEKGSKLPIYEVVEKYLSARNSKISENAKRIEQYTKIVIAREPFSRILSAFRDKIENGGNGEYYKHIYKKIEEQRGNHTKHHGVKFEDFVTYLTSDGDVQIDPHWNYYTRLCAPCDMEYDYVFHMDTVDEDMKFFADELGVKDFNFPPSFNSFTDFKKVTAYYSEIAPQLVNDLYHRYKKDYDIFGFHPPPQF